MKKYKLKDSYADVQREYFKNFPFFKIKENNKILRECHQNNFIKKFKLERQIYKNIMVEMIDLNTWKEITYPSCLYIEAYDTYAPKRHMWHINNRHIYLHGIKKPGSYPLPLRDSSIYYCHYRLAHYTTGIYFQGKSRKTNLSRQIRVENANSVTNPSSKKKTRKI